MCEGVNVYDCIIKGIKIKILIILIINNIININMHSFYQIIEKSSENLNNVFHQIVFSYFSIEENIKNIKNKYFFLQEIEENIFYTEEMKKEILYFFSQIQKTYFAFSKLASQYKWKKEKIMMDTDLCLNQIDLKDKNVICVFHQENHYLFIISDLINIFTTALTYSPNFFSSPLTIKNPYNNLPFSKSNLYNIYFTLFFKCILIPEIIQKFFQYDFDLDLFEKKNQILLRECAILNYLNNISDEEFVCDTKKMLESYNEKHYKKIEIDCDFPNQRLISIFKPYLFMYYISILSFDYNKKINYKEALEKMLFRLRYYFPRFGKKRIKVISLKNHSKTTFEKIVEFNEECPPFYCNKNNKYFLSSHLGLMKTHDINELLSDEKFIIHCNEMEKDRISIRYIIRNNQRLIEDFEDESITSDDSTDESHDNDIFV